MESHQELSGRTYQIVGVAQIAEQTSAFLKWLSSPIKDCLTETFMTNNGSFIIRNKERGYNNIHSQILPSGANPVAKHSTYLAGHPDAYLVRHSSFNFHEYQDGIDGFGKIRCFGDEIFSPNGCGYNMHPHHNFCIMSFVLDGTLTHINTAGKNGMVDALNKDDFYIFNTGSGGKHSELNISTLNELNAIYIWVIPDKLYSPTAYHRSHYDPNKNINKIISLIGNNIEDALPIEQDFKVSRLTSENNKNYQYETKSEYHGLYIFVIDGSIEIEKNVLERRDSMGFYGGVSTINFSAKSEKTDILIVETVM